MKVGHREQIYIYLVFFIHFTTSTVLPLRNRIVLRVFPEKADTLRHVRVQTGLAVSEPL